MAVEIEKKDMPKNSTNYILRTINKIDDLIYEGDIVEGYMMEVNKTSHTYGFFVVRNVSRSVDKKEFIRLVNHIVIDRVNSELSLFDQVKRTIEYDKFLDKVRYREYVIARYIAIGIVVEILDNQVNDEYMANLYNMDRCTIIHASSELEKYGYTFQLQKIIDSVRADAIKLYDALKQPQKIEVFEFLKQ